MLKIVDRQDDTIIVKQTNTRTGITVGFQLHKVLDGAKSVKTNELGMATKLFDEARTLAEARDKAGKHIQHPIKERPTAKECHAFQMASRRHGRKGKK